MVPWPLPPCPTIFDSFAFTNSTAYSFAGRKPDDSIPTTSHAGAATR
ncbi:MAG: hypothetical protein CFH03_00477 [Alphaproteobacteria bacterium MarineAlpha3_Bin2]|nr:MAG: hypothetical protein CFH02_01567 [Alphaproteobacteria bacterium MarineAlpha3_Bin1]PPR73920.1 MAG: hypothetical protein CFH03_00477 [Alphaproteobacteria bacterium MarineAlpha3_Bin2]